MGCSAVRQPRSSPEGRAACLRRRARLRDDVQSPPLNGLNEATVGVIYTGILHAIEFEIDCEDEHEPEFRYYWRKLVLAASHLDEWPSDEPPPGPECCDRDEWDCLVWGLAESVLWDDDWLDDGFIMDVDPETAAYRKDKLGITEEYYLAIAPDPTEADFEQAREALRQLTAE